MCEVDSLRVFQSDELKNDNIEAIAQMLRQININTITLFIFYKRVLLCFIIRSEEFNHAFIYV